MKKASSFSIFEPVLVISDLLFAMGAFVTGLWLSGWHVNIWDDLEGTAALIILGIITVSFFPTFHLYSYHVLFSKKQHFTNLIKSFFWSAMTLGIVLVLFNSSELLQRNYYNFLLMLVLCALGVVFLSRFFGAHLIDFLLSFGLAVFFVGVIGIVYQSGVPFFMTKEFMILGCFILAGLLVACERYFLVHIVFNRWFRRHFRRQVVVLDSDNEAERIVSHILEKDSPYFVVGSIKVSDSGSRYKLNNGKQEIGGIDDLPRIIEEYGIDDIIITGREIDKPQLVTILDYCTSARVNAWLSPQLMSIIDVKLHIDRFCGLPMILLGSQKRSWLFDPLKLLIDKLLALLALLLLSPVLLLIAVAVKIDSPGPVFYKPEVIGLNGTLFKMFKFRSMRMNSDNTIHKEYVSKLINGEIEKETEGDKPLKITDDPRVTRVGCFIRKSSLDELPQLFNVLQGNMSLVGPRPCLPYEFAIYKDWQKKRTIVQPGITGLWQITGRSEVVFEDMILLDFYYIFNRNIMLDFNIIFETIFVVLGRKGGY